jgi:hypothetical protein
MSILQHPCDRCCHCVRFSIRLVGLRHNRVKASQQTTMVVESRAGRPGRPSRGNSLLLSALRLAGYDLDCTPRTPDTDVQKVTVSAGGRYMHALPADVEPIRTLLVEYSGIRPDAVDRHVYQMVCNARFLLSTVFFHLFSLLHQPRDVSNVRIVEYTIATLRSQLLTQM